jgi:SAM-dependent methyltransferase
LALGLVRFIDHEFQGEASARVLDIGCGNKPYYPYFANIASEYVGLDLESGPHVDVVGKAEALPFGEEEFDVVLATQMLEHAEEPGTVLREINRVLRPGGVALVSTHGTFPYHPAPTDYWRWTQDGLVKIFRDNGNWSELRLEPAGGTVACFGYILAWYIAKTGLGPISAVGIATVNWVASVLDRVWKRGQYPHTNTLIGNFLVVARAEK